MRRALPTRWLACLIAVALVTSACSVPSWMGGKKKEAPKLPGERVTVMPPIAELKLDEALKNTPVVLPAPYANADWPQHTGVIGSANGNLAAAGNFDNVASATAGGGATFEHTLVTRPVVGGGMAFAMDAIGNISAHDAAKVGEVSWHVKGLAEEDEPDIMGGGLAFDQGKLYAASGRGQVAAFDAATGKELWHKALHAPLRSAPAVAGDKLYVITIDSQIFALSAATGDVAWTQHGIDETAGLMNSVSPAVSGDTVIAPYDSGELYALSAADGHELWSDSLGLNKRTQANAVFAGIGGDPVVDGAVVMAVSNGGLLGVFGLTQGQHVWARPVASLNTPWVAGNYLFVLSADNTLMCLVKFTGAVQWTTKLASYGDEKEKKDPIAWKGPVMVSGKLAVVGSNGQMMLVAADTGAISAIKTIPEGIYTSPVVAGGRIYLVGQDATLYELQ